MSTSQSPAGCPSSFPTHQPALWKVGLMATPPKVLACVYPQFFGWPLEALARRKEGLSKAESNCPTECGWEEEVNGGQGRERDLSGRRCLLIGHATLEIRICESAVGMGRAGRNKG